MSAHSRRLLLTVTAAALTFCTLYTAGAQAADAYPDKPIRFIVTYPPGGGADIVARLVAAKMTLSLGQQLIVENRPGANGQIGANTLARSAPDGYTIMLDATGFSINPALYPKLPYDGKKDFAPVSVLVRFPNVLVKNPKFAPDSVKSLVDYVHQQPGQVSYASSGTGSVQHLAGALFASIVKGDLVHIPYKGGGPALTDVAGGQVPIMFANGASALPFIQSEKVVPLATTGTERSAALPNVPTVEEAGVKGMSVYEWNALFVPANTPQAVIDKLAAAAHAAVNDPTVRKQLIEMGGEPMGASPADSAKFIDEQMVTWKGVVSQNQIKPN
ncbi:MULTISPECIES: tripartite tricarboxylate transporter substrate binding protein [unclassified Achromobacter]|uniref:Bug family tripartite tricarboxylate transporter substrate binding protein n=1 Tax=unclassified Achromobacter TaxID=2626865 RepID=UPI000B514C42|nr:MULTISPECIES: tripartite tricarboxylate transporter substrate binding protein [unclassified Achromobacter]OWT69102.1 LacI family transcriptional regulator [Achromobacter sp. HZ34]OWT70507.1 LacI family transcriptional regulator [Achromobacter sp. HZ28]